LVKQWCVLVLGRGVLGISWSPGGGGLTAPIPGLIASLLSTGSRVVSAVVFV
jgi:hypothetical protein